MSAATIDRLLRAARNATRARKLRRVTPEIRRRIAVRTFADWNEPPPGSMEMDLVAHCGEVNRGSYVHSLVLTDIASGWTECAPLVVRESTLLVETLERMRLGLPFPLRALDVDNGSEFVNETMIQYCLRNGIELTRSRPYRKNDQAWIEQKNGAIVRKLLGYRRFEGIAAAQALARLYGASRLFVNFFQPSFKLAEKHRQGAQVTKRYHPPQTPCERLLLADAVAEAIKVKLREVDRRTRSAAAARGSARDAEPYGYACGRRQAACFEHASAESLRVPGGPLERLASRRSPPDPLRGSETALSATYPECCSSGHSRSTTGGACTASAESRADASTDPSSPRIGHLQAGSRRSKSNASSSGRSLRDAISSDNTRSR